MPTDALSHAREVVAGMTPGPWHVNTTDEDGECVRCQEGHGEVHIATCDLGFQDTVKPEDQANAAGITLAVAILRALADPATVEGLARTYESERVRQQWDTGPWGNETPAYRAAIEKCALAALTFILDQAGRDAT